MINVLMVVKRYVGNYPLFNEMARLDPQRFRVVVCYIGGNDDGKNGMDAIADRCYYLGFSNRQTRFTNLSLLKALRHLIDQEHIQVVNCHLHRTTAPTIIAALISNTRPSTLSTLHGLGSVSTLRRKIANWLLYKKLFRIVAVSHAVRKDILKSNWGIAAEKVVTVQNGLDFTRFLDGVDKQADRRALSPDSSSGCWFGTAGRLSPVKNQQVLLQAFRKVVDCKPDAHLFVAGRGELESTLKGLTDILGLQANVHFLGFRSDIPQFLRALDVFLLPSLREGMPLSMLEAMASALPVIASAVGGIPEVFSERPMGKLIDPSQVDQLATAMIEMAELSPEGREQLGGNARDRALHGFTARRMVQDYEQLYVQGFESWQSRQ